MHHDPEAPYGVIRLAGEADNEQLLSLFGDIPMRGSVVLTTERAPRFAALYELQEVQQECWVYELDGRLMGLGTILSREGYIHGQPAQVAYLGDLRARKEVRGALTRFYGKVFGEFVARTGCAHFYTGILASNAQALRALADRGDHRRDQPRYDLLRRFDAAQLDLIRRPRRPSGGALRVRVAHAHEAPALAAFLDEDHRRRPFGYRYDQGELERRLASWPGFSLQQTYLCEDGAGRLRGVCTAWDADAVKRYRVLAYRGSMRWVRAAMNLGSRVMGYTPLPPAGQTLRYVYLANLSVPDRDPEVLSALISRVYADLYGRGYSFIMLYMEQGDPMRAALTPYKPRMLPFHLYSVHDPQAPPVDYGPGTAGFEIALA